MKKVFNFLLRHPFLTSFIFLCCVSQYIGSSVGKEAWKNSTNTPNKVGSSAGVKLSIPIDYLIFGGVTYEGESWLDPDNKVKNPNANNPISSIEMGVRLSDFAGMESSKEIANASLNTRFGDANAFESKNWLQILADYSPQNSMEQIIRRFIDTPTQLNSNVYYEQDQQQEYGLIHQIPRFKKDYKDTGEAIYDLYYNPQQTVLITCRKLNSALSEFEYDCEQIMYHEKTKLVISIYTNKFNLPKWKYIQDQTIKLIESFIVKS